MVVLSISLMSKTGRVHLSRQYVQITRIRIEGILAAFPKLIEEGEGMKQHTYVETGSIRYVYQPLEGMYVVLVTTRGSNIVQDLDTLRLVSKVIPEYTQVTEEDIRRNVFDLIFAFDEVVTLGYKENVTLQQIRTNLEMESHEEKLHQMIKASKMNEAKDEARRQAANIKARKLQGMSTGTMVGIGNTAGQGTYTSQGIHGEQVDLGAGAPGFGSAAMPDHSMGGLPHVSSSRYGAPTENKPTVGGLKIGKGLKVSSKAGKGLNMMQRMAKEEGIDAEDLVQQKSSTGTVAAPGAVVRSEPYQVKISETVSCLYDKNGAMHKIEAKGVVNLTCHEDDAKVRLQVEYYGDASAFNFTPHPNLSKPDFQENNVLQMKNPGKAFPKDKTLGILKWRYAAKEDETEVPLKVICWPESNGDGTVTVNMEAELLVEHYTLHNVLVVIPLGTGDAPEITSCESNGSVKHNAKRHCLEWELQPMDKENSTSQVEFVVPGSDESAFFPVVISFVSEDTICPIHIPAISQVETGEPLKFGLTRHLATDKYEVVEND